MSKILMVAQQIADKLRARGIEVPFVIADALDGEEVDSGELRQALNRANLEHLRG